MKAPIGAVVSLYVDLLHRVFPGDAIRTTTGRTYLVLERRQQERGQHIGRQHLRALVIEPSREVTGRVHDIVWYSRAKRYYRPERRA